MTDEELKAIARIDENLRLLRNDLLGNGQPGRLPRLEERLNVLERTNEKIINRLIGAYTVISVLISAFTAWLTHKFTGGHK